MATLYLIRHGSVGNPPPYYDEDLPLSEEGIREVEVLARNASLKRPQAVYSSLYKRALQTAEILARAFGLSVTTLPCLHERVLKPGRVTFPEFLKIDEICWKDPRHRELGAESLLEAKDRIVRCVEEIAATHEREDTVFIVSHGTVLSLLMSHLYGTPPKREHRKAIGSAHFAPLISKDGTLLKPRGGPDSLWLPP